MSADGTSYIRIRETARSTFRGAMLRLIRKERRKGSAVFDYLCEMPGWSRPGWFSHDEVDDAFGREGTPQEGQPCDGSRYCEAGRHIHGCFSDKGDCDHPSEHSTGGVAA